MSTQNRVTQSPEALAETARAAAPKGGLPPVHKWNPPYSGDLDIRIARDGTWYHEGGPIRRPALVRLFSSILKREGDAYFLVTPVEKVGITVEDAPFVAVDVDVAGEGERQVLTFETQVGDRVDAGPGHALRVVMDDAEDAPAPYVHVRAGLDALIDRKTFYRMVEHGMHRDGWFGLWSGGEFFRILPSDAMD